MRNFRILWYIGELTSINVMKVTHRNIFLEESACCKDRRRNGDFIETRNLQLLQQYGGLNKIPEARGKAESVTRVHRPLSYLASGSQTNSGNKGFHSTDC